MPKEAKNKEKKQVKQKSHFLKDTKAELKKVIWPTPKQLANNTLAVISIVVLIGVIVFVLDLCFDKMNAFGIDKLKQAVQSTTSNTETNNVETNSEEVEANTETVEDSAQTETSTENTTTQNNEAETNTNQNVENAE
jgi:preprotein translocase subunit SecE